MDNIAREGDLQQVMEDYGAVSSVKVVMDRETGKSKGFAFIEMEDDAAAAKAIAELNGAEYMGRTMVAVSYTHLRYSVWFPNRR